MRLRNILIVGLVIRILLIPFFDDIYNYWAFRTTASFAVQGLNPWEVIKSDPQLSWRNPWGYSPLYLIFVIFAHILSFNNEIVFLYLIKIPYIISDITIAYFIFKIVCVLYNENVAKKITTLYIFNPFVIIISSVWGTNDPLPIMFTIISLYYFIKSNISTDKLLSALFLGLGVALKFFPIMLLPAFIAKLKPFKLKVQFIIITILPLLIVLFPFFILNFADISSNLQSFFTSKNTLQIGAYNPTGNLWFWLANKNFIDVETLAKISQFLFITSSIFLFYISSKKEISLPTAITIGFIIIYLTSFRLWGNYFIWIIPFAYITAYELCLDDDIFLKLLPYFWIPIFMYMLLFNGLGASGIFYWTLPWLGLKIMAINNFPKGIEYDLILLAYTFLVSYLILIPIKAYKNYHLSPDIKISSSKKSLYHRNDSLLYLIFSYFILIIIIIGIFNLSLSNTNISIENNYQKYSFQNFAELNISSTTSSLSFFDNFSAPIIDFQWNPYANFGGNYSLHTEKSSSYVRFDTLGIGKGIYLERMFNTSSKSSVEVMARFVSSYPSASFLIMLYTNDGWLGVDIDKQKFIFYNKILDKRSEIGNLDYNWHKFKIIFNNSENIYFDDELRYSNSEPKKFSIIKLGHTDLSQNGGGIFDVDWIKVNNEQQEFKAYGRTLIFIAIFYPLGVFSIMYIYIKKYL